MTPSLEFRHWIDGRPLDPSVVVDVARNGAGAVLRPEALEAMAVTSEHVQALAHAETPVYGVSTGFGALATQHIPPDRRADLQRSLIRSHAASNGALVDHEVVRGLMLLRLRTLATGRTGVRPVVAETLAALINADVVPAVREYGSLGCSGDLAPLAHVALTLMGEGECADDMRAAGIEPITLQEKEGLALINGTEGMLAMLVIAIHDLRSLVTHADLAAAMSVEALLGTDRVFDHDLQELRPQPGQARSASHMRHALAGSEIVASHRGPEDTRVQDAYSLRCAPQVAGACRDTVEHAARVATHELASTIDNPVVLADGRVESNGNFHGAPVGYVLDFLAIACADLASISERRTDRMLDKNRSHGLPPFLAHEPGVDSGHMIAQYTQAGLVSEMKRLAAPASVDSIPSSAMQEDHVSMGWSAGLKLRRSIDALRRVLAIEILTAARAIDMRSPTKPAPVTGAVVQALRERVPGPGPDRYLAPEIEAAVELVAAGTLLTAAGLPSYA